MSMWNHYRSYEEFEHEELWSTDLSSCAYRGLEDGNRKDRDAHGPPDDDELEDVDLDLD